MNAFGRLSTRKKEIIGIVLFYFSFAFIYHMTLRYNQHGLGPDFFRKLVNPVVFVDSAGLHYLLLFLCSIPIWYLIFKSMRNWALYKRLLVHLVTMPVFIIATQQLYYGISDAIGWGHLQGTGQVWDLYIPALFYFIQFGVLHGYEHYRENQKKLIIEGELRQAALKSELAAIKAQLNPHFLYNVFNTINASVPAENEKTRQMIAQLSDLFRYQLQASQQELVTLREELEFVTKYLDLEKSRFQDRLKINIDVPHTLMDEKVPPMLLQPLVENSVKHGLASLIDGGEIHIGIRKTGDKLTFEISDTGVGIQDKTKVFGKGLGLTNTRARLQKMYQANMELLDNSPSGLTIRFAL